MLIVTQNVDDLHERAGATRLLHMHGELQIGACARRAGRGSAWSGGMPPGTRCAACGAPALRPDIVFFGEMPYEMERDRARRSPRADLFVSIGTSGAVYPAAGFVQIARITARATLELNLEPSAGSALVRREPAAGRPASWCRRGWSDAEGGQADARCACSRLVSSTQSSPMSR